MTTLQRFLNKVRKTHDCWLWEGAGSKSGRYGLFWFDGKLQCAHRVSYTISVGEIPQGLELDHLCKNTHCVNPGHLEVVTKSENQRRSTSPTGKNAAKTHCINGHPFNRMNTYHYQKNGLPARDCRICKRIRSKLIPRSV